MKVTIFGATGKIGQHLVKQALEAGHAVTAFTRSPEKLKTSLKGLRLVTGDVLDPLAVETAITGQDAVVCALGMPLMNGDGLREKGTKNIIHAMKTTDVRRLVCLSGMGAGDSFRLLPPRYRYFIAPFFMRRVYRDHERQERLVKTSGLDWVIARPSSFVEKLNLGSYQHGLESPSKGLKYKIAQADVADFLLRQLSDDTYLHRTPSISC